MMYQDLGADGMTNIIIQLIQVGFVEHGIVMAVLKADFGGINPGESMSVSFKPLSGF